ncbi:MAG TPA: DUF6600 domain-containing protein [Bryobacteraceae bacterium]|nr:DUF6600 domain-containing protein [Bryobacteraceae bacterium]
MPRRLLIAALAFAGTLAAQDPPAEAGRISYTSGTVSFEPAGVNDWAPATVNRPLTMGDKLYADSGGRAEVNVPGAAFRLGDRTALEFLNLDNRNVQVRLPEGTVDLRVRMLYSNVEVDTPNLAFTVTQPGEYRLDTAPDGSQTTVTVRDGAGQMTENGATVPLNMGQQAVVAGQGQAAQYKINPVPGYDSFDRWVMSRNRIEDRYAYAGHVSPEMVGYTDLGQYGTWRTAPDYGEIWVPRSVPAGWAPYHDGHWVWIEPWGWTWVDDAPWGFAPFHYGRWAYINGHWGWCPGPVAVAPVYAPALVAWVGLGGGLGVSLGIGAGPVAAWFPLGPRDVYIPPFTASLGFVASINLGGSRMIDRVYIENVYRGYQRTGSVPVGGYMNRTVPGAIVAVPQGAFASAQPVRQVAMRISPDRIGAIRTVDPAPRIAPQVASVLGRAPGGHVARPPAALMSRAIVARTAPPPRPVPFEQRRELLARTPGRPLPVSSLHETPVGRTRVAPVAGEPERSQPRVAHVQPPRNALSFRPEHATVHAQPAPHRVETHPAQRATRPNVSRPPQHAAVRTHPAYRPASHPASRPRPVEHAQARPAGVPHPASRPPAPHPAEHSRPPERH